MILSDVTTFAVQRILKVDYTIPSYVKISDECRDILSKILVAEPERRISVQGIKSHPWFLKDLPPGVAEMNNHLPSHDPDLQVQLALVPVLAINTVHACQLDSERFIIPPMALPALSTVSLDLSTLSTSAPRAIISRVVLQCPWAIPSLALLLVWQLCANTCCHCPAVCGRDRADCQGISGFWPCQGNCDPRHQPECR